MKEIIKEYLLEVISPLVAGGITSYSQLKERKFEVGQICTCIDLINKHNTDENYVVFHTNPCLAFYRNGKQISIEEI